VEEFRTVKVTRRTPHGTVVDEHQLLARRADPNDTETELPVEPAVMFRVNDGGDRVVAYQAAEIVSIRLT